ncbi:MAG: rRNA maturation RNAse YbeY, partial [Vicinamibacterales bacterium]
MTVTDGRGRPVRDGGLARWLAAVAPARLRGDIAVALVSDRHIRELNRRYRGKDTATDVLTFATAWESAPQTVPRASGAERHAAALRAPD